MAKVIQVDGVTYEIKKPTLEKLQEIVGGYIEDLRLPNGKHMIVNEDGRLEGLMMNPHASILYGNPIVGNVIICSKGELDG